MRPVGVHRIDLLCLPCAGASATMYWRWRSRLPAWIQVVPLELPGRGARLGEPCLEDCAQLVDRLCAEQAGSRRAPYALFGHSMGALLAHGMALRLRAHGAPLPQALFVSGSPAPAMREPTRNAPELSDAELIAELRRQGGTPDAVFRQPELMEATLKALRSDFRVCASVRPAAAAPLDLPIHVFAGRADTLAPEGYPAWRLETRMGWTLDWFEGGHFFIRQSEGHVLAAIVRELACWQPAEGSWTTA